MRIVLISTPLGFLGSGKGGGVELTLNSLVSGLLSLGHSVDVIAPTNSKLHKSNKKAKLHFVEGEDQISWQHINYNSPVTIPDNSLLAGMLEKGLEIAKQKNEFICFVSGKYDYYKEFDFFKLSSKNLIIHTPGDLTYGELLVKELKKDCINLLPLKAQLLPEK